MVVASNRIWRWKNLNRNFIAIGKKGGSLSRFLDAVEHMPNGDTFLRVGLVSKDGADGRYCQRCLAPYNDRFSWSGQTGLAKCQR